MEARRAGDPAVLVASSDSTYRSRMDPIQNDAGRDYRERGNGTAVTRTVTVTINPGDDDHECRTSGTPESKQVLHAIEMLVRFALHKGLIQASG